MSKLLRTRVLRWLALAALCAASGVKLLPRDRQPQAASQEPLRNLVWPALPNRATIRFLNSLPAPEGSTNLRESLFHRLGRVLFAKSNEAMARPFGLAGKNGVLYVTDPGGHAVFIFDPQKKSLHKITKAGSELLISPVGVAVGKEF